MTDNSSLSTRKSSPTWHLYSDQTERGGKTIAAITQDPLSDSILIEGKLIGIIGANGTRVGFVGVRKRVRFDPSALIITFEASGLDGLHAHFAMETARDSASGIEGHLTYQCKLAPVSGETYSADLSLAQPIVRGRVIPSNLVAALLPQDILTAGLEIRLSEQEGKDIGVPFRIEIKSQFSATRFRI